MTYVNSHFLVETDWLASNLDRPDVQVFDVTGMLTSKLENIAEERHYAAGHIPGAAFLDVASAKGALSNGDAKLPWMWPTLAQFEQSMSAHGVNSDSHVVMYAATPREGIDNGTMWATRTWWTMHHFGITCSVLNGGFERWVADGHPVSPDASSYAKTDFRVSSVDEHAVVDKAGLLSALAAPDDVTVVDALSLASYGGQDQARYGHRKGHITGAVSLPMADMLDSETGRFLDADAMAARLEEAGLLSADKVITYCGGGIAATVDAFCLRLLGHENVSIYDASLLEWAPDESLPMTDPAG